VKNKNACRYLRNLAIFLALSLVVLLPGATSAAGNAVVSVSAPADTLDPGEEFTVSINVEPNNAIAGMQFNLSYDPNIVTVDIITEGNMLNQGGASTYFNAGQIDNVAGTITGVFGAITSPGQTVAMAGTFAVITMTAGSAGGSCPLTLSNVVVGDAASQPIPVSVINGAIDVEASSDPPSGGDDNGGGGGGGGGGGTSDTISLRGLIDANGEMIEDIVATDSNSKVELHIAKGTIVKNKYGQVLTNLRIALLDESQLANAGSVMIGQSYEIGPSGATFNGSVNLVFRYSNSEIPADVPVSNLYIALWDPDAMTWTDLGGTVDANAGTVSVPISHLSIYTLMAHNRPANLVVTNFTLTPHEVDPGETVIASIMIENQGDLTGTYEASLILDNTVVQNKTVTLSGGDSETLVFNIILDTVGEHQVSLGGLTATFVVKQPPAAAAFTVNELKINPNTVNAGEKANISVYIKNTGDLAGTYSLTLSIDDVAVETREVTLDGGGSMTVGFNFTTDVVGTHMVSIDDLKGVLEVKPLSSPAPPTKVSDLELNSFSTTPTYDKNTDALVSVKIEYELNQAWAFLSGARLVMKVSYNGEIIEQVPLLTLEHIKDDGLTGELNYVPTGGWKPGEYLLQAELFDGENLVQQSLLHSLSVIQEAETKVVSWWTLAAVIGIATVLIVVLLAVVVYRRRDMLRY
jgi:hypothetical protein